MLRMIYELILMEFKDFFRNPAILFWSIGFPVILATVLGFAFSKKEETIKKIGVIQSSESSLITKLKSLPEDKDSYTKFIFLPMTLKEAEKAMKRGEIGIYLQEDLGSKITYFFDPNNSDAHLSYLVLDRRLNKQKKSLSKIHELKNQGERYIDFLIPGLLAFGIMNSCMWGTGWSLMDMRMKKLLRRMISTPLPKWVFLFSHFVSRSILSSVEFLILIFFSNLLFHVKIQGSYFHLTLIFLSANFAFTGLAIFASSRASNNSVANGVINSFTFPMMLVSGVFFSYHNFPDLAVNIIQYLPLTLTADSIREIFLEQMNLVNYLTPIVVLNLTGLVFFIFGIRIYKWD